MFRPRVVIIDYVEEKKKRNEGERNGEEQLKAIKLIDDISNASLSFI